MEKSRQPVWETALLIVSFITVWVWFLARHVTLGRPGGQMSPWWHVLLIVLLAGMATVTVRRMRRVVAAMRDNAKPEQPARLAQRNGQPR